MEKSEVRSQKSEFSEQRPSSRSFQDLVAWQKAHQFVLSAYQYSANFPKEERFSLALQLRRAAISIPANIAEGFRRRSKGDKVRFFNIAQASIEECKYFLILANDLGYGSNRASSDLLEETSRLLDRYVQKILTSDF